MARVVQWIALVAWIALFRALGVSASPPESGTMGARPQVASEKQPPALEEPPPTPDPAREDVWQLAEIARRLEWAVMYLGARGGDSGTAFVVSRKHRLLAACAHIADILKESGRMLAIVNGSSMIYKVERAWYHPDYKRATKEGVFVRTAGRWLHFRDVLGPDIAVLQLSADGPDLPREFEIATPADLRRLAGTAVGVLGFSGPWPLAGRRMTAVFKAGTVSLVSDFTPEWDRAHRWRLIDFTAPGGEGASGGPVFTREGRVIAMYAWSRFSKREPGDKGEGTAAAIRIDALWELLRHHRLLED